MRVELTLKAAFRAAPRRLQGLGGRLSETEAADQPDLTGRFAGGSASWTQEPRIWRASTGDFLAGSLLFWDYTKTAPVLDMNGKLCSFLDDAS